MLCEALNAVNELPVDVHWPVTLVLLSGTITIPFEGDTDIKKKLRITIYWPNDTGRRPRNFTYEIHANDKETQTYPLDN